MWPAHPRACGENVRRQEWVCPEDGSSPRVRGKRKTTAEQSLWEGLIPARAGKTAIRY